MNSDTSETRSSVAANHWSFAGTERSLLPPLISRTFNPNCNPNIKLGIPEKIHSHGRPISLSELVCAIGIPSTKSDWLRRLMLVLVNSSLISVDRNESGEEELYFLTPSGRLLLKDHPFNIPSFAWFSFPELNRAGQFLSNSFHQSNSVPFQMAHGMSFWDFISKHDELNKGFQDRMISDSRLTISAVVNECSDIFQDLKSLVDVGVGSGTAARLIAETFPHVKCTVYDLPCVIETIPENTRVVVDSIGGDMFEYIPQLMLKVQIPEKIHSHGQPISLSELVSALGIPSTKSDCLRRLMLLLVHMDLVSIQKCENGEKDLYSLTLSGRILLKHHPFNLDPSWSWFSNPALNMAGQCLCGSFHQSNSTPFEMAHQMSLRDFLSKKDELNRQFNDLMASDSRLIMNAVVKECSDIFQGLKSLVDVGGGNGTAARLITEAFPHMKCTVYDLPHVIATIPESTHSIVDSIGGDMFQYIPPSDAIFLKSILHDWSDEDCVRILKRCKEAIPPKEDGGKVIIIDIVLGNEDDKSFELQLFFDITMMVLLGAKERTEGEWKTLFKEAGFSDYKIKRALGFRSIIELYP
ncbi:PREDICTED: trans-resveratrol di-O-methyltransferase-like [Nelumbo nucifera]|uniref:Trans-resveratrol di-O-methyltransferase-like n=1 Tax=Nelumbo nucifera TaxID=4432 RepID=A0A1U7Z7G9_NELNU|nr:PREDICTED: trans-resveratrol di-O-methyltransferase-like [Nelumbo nucifera]